jgi:hypothetical protein
VKVVGKWVTTEALANHALDVESGVWDQEARLSWAVSTNIAISYEALNRSSSNARVLHDAHPENDPGACVVGLRRET